ncbi:DUF1566 domain-containing protein [bacterium]|nr:DUF1566 domain-containing protein [bacterium]
MKKLIFISLIFAICFFTACGGSKKINDEDVIPDSDEDTDSETDGDSAEPADTGDTEPDGDTGDTVPPAPDPVCGDKTINGNEVCDGSNITCTQLGIGNNGTIPCKSDCSGWESAVTRCQNKNAQCEEIPDPNGTRETETITQTWSNSGWIPSTRAIHADELTSNSCAWICKENYTWDSDLNKCVSEGGETLPDEEPAQDEDTAPATDEDEEPSTDEDSTPATDTDPEPVCGNNITEPGEFCDGNSISCVEKELGNAGSVPCKADCSGRESAAGYCQNTGVACAEIPDPLGVRNTDTIVQTWDGEQWLPLIDGNYNEAPAANTCDWKCKENHVWDEGESKCIPAQNTVPCTGLIANAKWNSVEEVIQTWNEENQAWEPAVDPVAAFNYEASATECRFICKDDENGSFMWDPASGTCIPRVVKTICTGQTKCTNGAWMESCPLEGEDYFGQDAQHTDTCVPINLTFKNNDPETHLVVDGNTELEWYNIPKLSDDPENPAPVTVSYEDAVQYCAGLTYDNDASRQWRLPTIKEILSITNLNYAEPAFDHNLFQGFVAGKSIWSNTPRVCTLEQENSCNDNDIWTVGVKNTNTNFYDVSDSTHSYALCVRGDEYNHTQIPETYTIGEDTVVLDRATNLIWNLNRQSVLSWKDALAHCENMEYAGFNDWRLPNRNELISIINYDNYYIASDMPFNITSQMTLSTFYTWTSSIRSVAGGENIWDISLTRGTIGYALTTASSYFTICVR